MHRILILAVAGLLGFKPAAGLPANAKTVGVAATAMPDTLTTPPLLAMRALVPGHGLVAQERVTTGPMGPAQLLLLDQSAVTISPRSELTIDAFVYDPTTRTGQMAINLSHGLMRYVGGRLSKNGTVSIKTPVATMGVRGGIAHVNVLSPTAIEVTLVYGDWIRGETTAGQRFELTRAGEFTRIEFGELPTPPVIIPPRTIQRAAASLGIQAPETDAQRSERRNPEEGGRSNSGADSVTETTSLAGEHHNRGSRKRR